MQYTISEDNIIIENKTYTGNLGAYEICEDHRPRHTFRTQTVLVDGNDVTFRHCRFENTAGPGSEVGQAIALYLDGDDIVLDDCDIYGHQDSLFLAPLPPKEYEKDGFLGPKQFTPRTLRRISIRNSRISGGVDFIFGGAMCIFENCDFISIEPGYVFAPCTPEGAEYGFIARNCRFLRADGVPDGSVYIGRPWREYARVRLENCYLDSHIASSGWDDWQKKEAHKTIFFEEYGSYGPGACDEKRASYVKVGQSATEDRR